MSRFFSVLLAALLAGSCAAPPPARLAPPSGPRESHAFSRALPLLVEAEAAADHERFAEASRLFERALPLGVRSANLFYTGARMAARRGAPDVAFADLESMRGAGIKDEGLLLASTDLASLHADARWPALISRVRGGAQRAHDPEASRIVTEDIDHFWQAYDAAKEPHDRARVYELEYVDRASPGLQSFFPVKIGPLDDLLKTIDAYRTYYDSVRACTQRVRELEPRFRTIFRRLKAEVPDATFPDITFVVGRMASGGTSTADGLIIGTEQTCMTPESPVDQMSPGQRGLLKAFDDITPLVAHELVHFQQHFKEERSLLASALEEGGADFVGELISGKTANAEIHPYGDSHERALWEEFRADMHSTDEKVISRWLWNHDDKSERPGDLGYYVGYRIIRAYYAQQSDKRRALRAILDVSDGDAFVAASGYSPQ